MKTWQKKPDQFAIPEEIDYRYETVKMYIQKKRITKFKEIFKHIPKTVVALDMHTNNNRMTALMQRPWELTFEEAYFIATLIGIEFKVLSALIERSMVERAERKKAGTRELAPGKV